MRLETRFMASEACYCICNACLANRVLSWCVLSSVVELQSKQANRLPMIGSGMREDGGWGDTRTGMEDCRAQGTVLSGFYQAGNGGDRKARLLLLLLLLAMTGVGG